ncbi:MAG: ammonia channel protein [Parvibaculum sp.]|jgi:Amt family ammonium transporter|uniref:ammonium transporter n=2 Tax=Parvibaculum sp. TaxID=2024848 RepID=UPI000C57580C|nr:ammonia channel protein [Parvibaculum sp.]HAC59787.1 ammonia channel protein [Rhodobiaceae bacterium]|tara:strand:+ start:969 stop:2303 length:1335 start_codon:yes stop_codon:yes gene_type:complete
MTSNKAWGFARSGALGMAAASLGLLATAGTAFAQEEAPAISSGDTAWMLTSTALVLLMTIPGLALFYGGMVRKKNVVAMTAQNFALAAIMTVVWMVIGYSLAFGDGGAMNAYIGGLDNLFLSGLGVDAVSGTIPESVFMMFQMTFAIITPALITGAYADRMKFSSMIFFMVLWSIFVYAPVCHWVWGGGFLGQDGVLDFAGGTVVHINAGIAGLIACLVLGPRKGFGTENLAPHNVVLTMIGAAFLWVGWFGFNAGSQLAADGRAGMAMAVTQIAAAVAAVSWMAVEWIMHRKPTLLGLATGAVAGLVAITPAAGFVDPMGALWIGLGSGVICYFASTSLKRALGYDDALDVFGVHAVGGIVGAVLTGVFATAAITGADAPLGAIDGNWGQVGVQIKGIVATIIYSGIATFVLLMVTKIFLGLRVTPQEEVEGLDISQHGEVIH